MTKFRFHRGGYAESMDTAVECRSMSKLRLIIKARANDTVTVEPYGGIDNRNGWDTYIVMHNGHPIGMTDGPARKAA